MLSQKQMLFAILLSVIPGLGQVYADRLYRGFTFYFGLIFISWISAIVFTRIDSRYITIVVLCIPFIYALAICADAAYCVVKPPQQTKPIKIQTKWYRISVFILITFSANMLMDYLIGKHIVRAFFVTTESMSPNIMKYDLLLIDKITQPLAGDVVLLEFSGNNKDESIFKIIESQTLRRIIAAPGDRVEIVGTQVYVNNLSIKEKYIRFGQSHSHNIYISKNYRWGPEVVPADSFFVLSDSRQYGFDSRTFGFVPKSYIRGTVSKVLWSWNLDDGHFKWERTALNIK
ncbi:MAG: signal peptidase I [Candidatus Thiodiazotropha sp.]